MMRSAPEGLVTSDVTAIGQAVPASESRRAVSDDVRGPDAHSAVLRPEVQGSFAPCEPGCPRERKCRGAR